MKISERKIMAAFSDKRNDAGMASAHFAAAFDIGTTSIAASLCDLTSCTVLASEGCTNPQKIYSDDVIGRAVTAVKKGVRILSEPIHECMDGLMEKLCNECGVSPDGISLITVAGNTCMQHIAADILPSKLLKFPYSPNVRGTIVKTASELGLHGCPHDTEVLFLPVIGGFVGGDTVAAMAAEGMLSQPERTLLIDIGTNGETVLKASGHMYACSAAAGPAFEGAQISCGMRCTEGAVYKAELKNGCPVYHVTGDVKATGICGSGLIDIVFMLRNAGVIGKDGTFTKTSDMPDAFSSSMRISPEGKRLLLLTGGIYITQDDIRQLQLAKSAVRTCIKLLCSRAGISEDSIVKILAAGAFGSFLDPVSAEGIGMLPEGSHAITVQCGNSALKGAEAAAFDPEIIKTYTGVIKDMQFTDTGAYPDFQKTFTENMDFPN